MAMSLLTVATVSFASDDGFYLTGGIGQDTNDNTQANVDNVLVNAGGVGFNSSYTKPTVWKVQAGMQLNKYLALEFGPFGASNRNYTAQGGNLNYPITANGTTTGWDTMLIAMAPISSEFSLIGKVGVATIKNSATVSGGGISESQSQSKTDATYGVGAQYDFSNKVFGRISIDNYNIADSNAANRTTVVSIDVGVHFWWRGDW